MASEAPKLQERSIDEMRADLRRSREQVATSAIVLREKVQRASQLRQWLVRSPVLFAVGAVVGALAVGYALGRRGKKSKSNGALSGLQTLARLLGG